MLIVNAEYGAGSYYQVFENGVGSWGSISTNAISLGSYFRGWINANYSLYLQCRSNFKGVRLYRGNKIEGIEYASGAYVVQGMAYSDGNMVLYIP